jgi:hypothetical protein
MQLDVNGKRDVTGKRLDFLYLPENRTFHDRSQSIGSVPKELKKNMDRNLRFASSTQNFPAEQLLTGHV